MSATLTAAGLLLLGLLALMLVLLSIPWVVTILVRSDSERRVHVELRPFASRFPAHLGFDAVSDDAGADTQDRKQIAEKDRDPEKPDKKTGSRQLSRGRALRMVRAIPRLLGGLLSVFRIERLRLSGKVGLDDPSETGMLFGIILPLSFMLPAPRFSIELQPVFDGALLAGEAELCVRIIPIRIVPPAARFGWQVFVSSG